MVCISERWAGEKKGLDMENRGVSLMEWQNVEEQLKARVGVEVGLGLGVRAKQQKKVEVMAELRVSVQMEHSSWQNSDQGMDYIHTD